MTTLPRRAALAGLLALVCAAPDAIAGPGEQRILVFGDSQAQGLAAGLIRAFRSDREVRVLDRSKIGTGLARPVFDWPAQAQTLATTERARVAIAMFGANDRPPRSTPEAREDVLHRFTEGYAPRVAAVARPFREAGIPLIWVGHPTIRDPAYSDDITVINEVFADSAVAEGAIFIPSWDSFTGPDGLYTAYGPGTDGQTTRLRADDGVHLTPAGYDVLTALLLPEVDRVLQNRG